MNQRNVSHIKLSKYCDIDARLVQWNNIRLTCAWQYFGTLIFELFFEIIRFYVDNINFLFLC